MSEIITDPEVNTDEPDSCSEPWPKICFTCGRPEGDHDCIEPPS